MKICYIVSSEHPEVIEGGQRLISMEIPGPGEADVYGYIDADGDSSDEEEASGSGEAGVSTGVTKLGKNRWKRCSRL